MYRNGDCGYVGKIKITWSGGNTHQRTECQLCSRVEEEDVCTECLSGSCGDSNGGSSKGGKSKRKKSANKKVRKNSLFSCRLTFGQV